MKLTINLDDLLTTLKDSPAMSLTKCGVPPTAYTIVEELQNYDKLQTLALNEIRGMFTEDEICLIADTINSYWYRPEEPKLQLLFGCKDSMELDGLDDKWVIDKQAFLGKLTSLSQFHAHVVLAAVKKCWEVADNEANTLLVLLRKHFQVEELRH